MLTFKWLCDNSPVTVDAICEKAGKNTGNRYGLMHKQLLTIPEVVRGDFHVTNSSKDYKYGAHINSIGVIIADKADNSIRKSAWNG